MALEEVLGPFAASPAAYVFAFALGAIFGSFANVCIYRLPPTDDHPEGQSVVSPGSRCGACGTPVKWYDNIPIASWLILRGRCRTCGVEFSPRYLLVEVATGMLFATVYYATVTAVVFDEPLAVRLGRFAVYGLFVVVMVVIAFIDLDHKLILDKVTYPAIPAFYAAGLLLPERAWSDGLIGIVVGYGVVRAIADGYYYLTGREGLGYGDGKLLALIGAVFGWQGVVFSLFGGSLLGSVIGITVAVSTRKRGAGGDANDARDDAAAHDVPAGDAAAGDAAAGDAAAGDAAAGDAAADDVDPDGAEPPSIRHMELPFGPFLAAAAVAYLFAYPWVKVQLAAFWGVE